MNVQQYIHAEFAPVPSDLECEGVIKRWDFKLLSLCLRGYQTLDITTTDRSNLGFVGEEKKSSAHYILAFVFKSTSLSWLHVGFHFLNDQTPWSVGNKIIII